MTVAQEAIRTRERRRPTADHARSTREARAASKASATTFPRPQWMASALDLQRSAGNAVTTSVLQSGPPTIQLFKGGFLAEFFAEIFKAEEEIAAKKAGKGKLPKGWAGGMRSFSILTDAFGDVKKMTGAKIELLSPSEMKTKYDGFYGKGSYKKDGPLEGFEQDGVNYLNLAEQSVDTVIHESLHSQEHDDWDKITYNDDLEDIGEGATEILTGIAATKAGLKPSTSYPAEATLVRKMCLASSLENLKKAYFLGDATFKSDVEKKLTGTWAAFKKKVKANDHAGARAMIKLK